MSVQRAKWIAVAVAVSMAIGWLGVRPVIAPSGLVPGAAWTCAMLSLFWSLLSLLTPNRGKSFGVGALRAEHYAALFFGVAAAIVSAVVLVMRFVYVAIDLLHGYPGRGSREFGFDGSGLATLGLLAGSCAAGLISTRDARVATCLFWVMTMAGSWFCLLSDPHRTTVTGGFERTDSILLLCGTLAGVILFCAVLTGRLSESGFFRADKVDADSTGGEPIERSGLRGSVAGVCIALTPLLFHQLLVPVGASLGGFRTSALGVIGSAMVASLGCVLLMRRTWGASLIDAAMGLASVALCGGVMLAIPPARTPLADAYPRLFAAFIVGGALGSGLWTMIAETRRWIVGEEAFVESVASHARRFAFHCAAIGLLACTLLAFWPRMPGIAAMDHTLGAVLTGFAANLFLLLAMLMCSRRLGRPTYRLLTVLSAVSTIGFLVVRSLPFASHSG